MEHTTHGDRHSGAELTRLPISATLHCLIGCAIGEVLGMLIGTALGWSHAHTIALAVAWIVTVPVNRWLIARGRGHAVVHRFHGGGDGVHHRIGGRRNATAPPAVGARECRRTAHPPLTKRAMSTSHSPRATTPSTGEGVRGR